MLRDASSRHLQTINESLKIARLALADWAAGVFATTGRINLVADVSERLIRKMVTDLSGAEIRLSPSLIFDPATSLRKRRELDAELGRIIAALRRKNPASDDDEIGMLLSFAVLANDASQGILMANLTKTLAENISVRFDHIDWPQKPTEAGIRFIERIATCPVEIGGRKLAAGSVVRAEMQGATRDGDAALLFGIGRHVCLGRGFFWAFWRDLVAALAKLPVKVATIDIGPTSNRVFPIPDYVWIEVTN